MTGLELQTLNTEIRGGRQMDDVTFYTLLNLAKSEFERRRPWRKLIKKDTSNSSSPSTINTTQFTMPADFIMTLPRRTLRLLDTASSSFLDLKEVPFESWDEYKNSSEYFTIDHLNSVYYVGGTVSKTYTHSFSYISSTTTLASGVTWSFPSEFHPALAFAVAAMDELGMDYDDINARQGSANITRAELIIRLAVKWDETLTRSALGI